MDPANVGLWLAVLTILVLSVGGLALASYLLNSDARDNMQKASDDADQALGAVQRIENHLYEKDGPSTGKHGRGST